MFWTSGYFLWEYTCTMVGHLLLHVAHVCISRRFVRHSRLMLTATKGQAWNKKTCNFLVTPTTKIPFYFTYFIPTFSVSLFGSSDTPSFSCFFSILRNGMPHHLPRSNQRLLRVTHHLAWSKQIGKILANASYTASSDLPPVSTILPLAKIRHTSLGWTSRKTSPGKISGSYEV